MTKKQITGVLGIAILLVLGYFALNMEDEVATHEGHNHSEMMPQMGGHGSNEFITHLEKGNVTFNEFYKIDNNWTLKVIQFEPDARLAGATGSGAIESESTAEINPAIKVEFYKDGEYQHYQICFKSMTGMHSKKPNQIFFVDFLDYTNFRKTDDGHYAVDEVTIKIKEAK